MAYKYFNKTGQVFVGIYQSKSGVCPYYILSKELPKGIEGFYTTSRICKNARKPSNNLDR